MTVRPYVFRAPTAAGCWLRDDMAEVVAHDRPTALLCWLIFTGSRLPFTVTREIPTREEQAA